MMRVVTRETRSLAKVQVALQVGAAGLYDQAAKLNAQARTLYLQSFRPPCTSRIRRRFRPSCPTGTQCCS